MTDNPHIARLDEMKADVLRRAANPEHVWDEKAIDWPLTKKSVVVEVGGYCGRWALQIADRYHCRLFVFEPQPWAWNVCASVLGDRATVLNYGLGDESGMLAMRNWETDGASFIKAEGQGSGMVREVGAAFKELGIKRIDLMLMNIESYEYVLLPHMLDLGILPRRLMVQFHPWHDAFDEYGMALAKLHTRMGALGYKIAWTYGIMLTAWERDLGKRADGVAVDERDDAGERPEEIHDRIGAAAHGEEDERRADGEAGGEHKQDGHDEISSFHVSSTKKNR